MGIIHVTEETQGATFTFTLYYYCDQHQAVLTLKKTSYLRTLASVSPHTLQCYKCKLK